MRQVKYFVWKDHMHGENEYLLP